MVERPSPPSRVTLWGDLVLALAGGGCTVLLALAVPGSVAPGWIGWGYVAVNAALSVCLATRNRWRRTTFAAAYVLLGVMAALVYVAPVNMGVSPLIVVAPLVLYTVARYEPAVWGAVALLLGLVGTLASPTHRVAGGGGFMLTLAILVMVATYLWANSLRRSHDDHVKDLERAQAVAQAEAGQRIALAQATERGRIASEVHDIVGHSLTVVIVQANTALALHDADLALRTLDDVRDGAKQALAELRSLVSELRTNDSTRVTGDLTDLSSMVRNASGAGLDITWALPEPSLLEQAQDHWPAASRLAVTRIVQESLTNVMKHAATPARAHLEVTLEDGSCVIALDNHVPMGSHTLVPGNGILGLQERARQSGGSYRVLRDGHRLRVRATIPTTDSRSDTA